ncbi:hypothetical protein ACFOW1_06575 [Parasediminibacterium paludis]|uniref:Uncharacterized protein n=1 Tax=Parasediminibacterium paludis TaxID=908966 RepID=A0ABV8PWD8_9BACT
MISPTLHTFHIPVMGLGFTIDTPIKVARFGISSVMSIVEDELAEQMRAFYSKQYRLPYTPISAIEDDYRAKRVTAYLNMVKQIVDAQVATLKALPFESGTEITKYFELLPNHLPIKQSYLQMLSTNNSIDKQTLQEQLRAAIIPGALDVNLMSKVDKNNYDSKGELLPAEYSDALAGLRGFANSNLESSIVFSAGYNPRLYAYVEKFNDFFPDENGVAKKKVILKVSDYRSALTQGKILAKKGIWVSEFRIESGLNCGGHAFATDGLLLGPILEEFKQNKAALEAELFGMCNQALAAKAQPLFTTAPALRITVQGGIGTTNEDQFLLEHYQANSTGWGSPFLLVPEATSVDSETLQNLATAQPEDYYLSNISPLGVPFNSFKKASSEIQRVQRIAEGRPGSPCTKKYLIANTEFSEQPICTASRKYQNTKINQILSTASICNVIDETIAKEVGQVVEKDCLCEGLGTSALLCHDIAPLRKVSKAVLICPGPNLAYFSGIFSLKQMVDFIYGRIDILNGVYRPNMFVNELNLYVSYFKKEIEKSCANITTAKTRQLRTFRENLLKGIGYYQDLTQYFKKESAKYILDMREQLLEAEAILKTLSIPGEIVQPALVAMG